MNFDQQLFKFFNYLAGQHWLLDGLIIFSAQYLAYILLVFFVFLIFWRFKNKRQRLYFLFLSGFSLLIARGVFVEMIRFFYDKLRPFQSLGIDPLISSLANGAMPSGHATVFFAIAALVFLFDKNFFWYFLAGAFLVGVGRIAAGVHWPMDILAGAVVGVLSVIGATYLLPKVK